MKRKYVRLASIILAIVVFITLILNFGANFWLRNNLSDYIRNNTDYNVKYKSLDVDLFSGDIVATGINVANKNTGEKNITKIQGDIDTLSVSRLGVYDALFNKTISSNYVLLVKPDLQITLAKPVDDKTGKKKNPVLFKNLMIRNGNITVFRYTNQKFLSVKNLDLNVEKIKMSEESVERVLPMIFDKYDIQGQDFYFRPDDVYAVSAQSITTESGLMSVKNFTVTPQLSFRDFLKFHPGKKSMIAFKSSEMNFRDIVLDEGKIGLSNARFENPDIKIMTTGSKSSRKRKDLNMAVNMADVLFKNAKILVLNPDGRQKMSAGDVTVKINKFVMDGETSKSSLPFEYADFNIAGRQINYNSNTQNVSLAAMVFNPKGADLRNLRIKPVSSAGNNTVIDLNAERIQLKINELKFIEKKLKLDVENVIVNSVQGKILPAKNKNSTKSDYSGIQFPLTVKNVQVKNSKIAVGKAESPIVLSGFNATIQNMEMNASTVKNGFPFKIGEYNLTTNQLSQSTKFYNIKGEHFKFTNRIIQLSNFAVTPKVSRAQFIRMIPTEKDLYDIKAKHLSALGSWDFLSGNQYINASQVTINQMNANIFRSKIPKDDTTEKPMYSALLRSLKIPMYIQNFDVKNSVLEYEEDTKTSDGPGKLTFGSFNMNIKNLNSGKMKGKPTEVLIAIKCMFMNASPMNVRWNYNVLNLKDAFNIAGTVADLPASRVNPFVEPYLKIRVTGQISELIFNFNGNKFGLGGTMSLKHQDLKVSLLRQDGRNNKLLSALANIFVRSDSGKYPESVIVDNVERDNTKSFFNLFWKGIEEGLKKTLIGRNVENTEKAVKTTVTNTKAALDKNKKDLQETKQDVVQKVEVTKEKVEEKGKFLKNIFKKKSE